MPRAKISSTGWPLTGLATLVTSHKLAVAELSSMLLHARLIVFSLIWLLVASNVSTLEDALMNEPSGEHD